MTNSFSIFEYLYRDSGNFKVWGALLLSGSSSDEDEAILRSYLEAGELFVAEQVGIPVLYLDLWALSNGRTHEDHAYHEFVALRPATLDDDLSGHVTNSVLNLLAVFRRNMGRWNCSLSPNA
jgi:hypothetical protein